MNGIRTKRSVIRLFAAVFPLLLILGLALAPYLLKTDSELIPLSFAVAGQRAEDNAVIIRGSFLQALPEKESLQFYAENAEIELSINGVRTRYNTKENTPRFFRSPGSGWFAFESPGIQAGQPVEITVRSYYGKQEQAVSSLLSRLYLGESGELFKLMLGQIGFFGFLQIVALIAGIIYMGEGCIDIAAGMETDGIRIAIFGFFCFTGGLWSVTDALYPYLTLLVSPPWLASVLDVSGLLLFPIALAVMMRYYMRRKNTRRMMNAILFLEIIMPVIGLFFQLAGVADLLEQQAYIGTISLLSLGVALVCIALELQRYRDGYLLLLLLTVLPIFVAIALEGINLFWPFMQLRHVMRYSFGMSVLLLILQLASYAHTELVKVETLRTMKNELAESQISILLSQIKPHFLYNALLGIKQLCDTDPKKASYALEHFAHYLRGNLYSVSDPQLIPFSKEVEHVQNYLYLEKMRFEDRVTIHWNISFTEFMLPSLTLQPLVENAIRHGIMPKANGGTLTIQSVKTMDDIQIIVSDDGVGFDMNAAKSDGRQHIGIINVRKRIEIQCGGKLEIHSAPGRGTAVKIILPRCQDDELR